MDIHNWLRGQLPDGNRQISGFYHAGDLLQHDDLHNVYVPISSQKVRHAGELAFIKIRFGDFLKLVSLEGATDLAPAHTNVDIAEFLRAIAIHISNQAVQIVLEFYRQLLSGETFVISKGVG